VAAVNDLAEVISDPHVRARGSITEVEGEGGGPVLLPGPSSRLAATPGHLHAPAPGIGEGEAEVLDGWLEG
jgi:formyl-CoA transferase